MATILRELIGRVIFKADTEKLKSFDKGVDALKTKLLQLDAKLARPVKIATDSSGVAAAIAQAQKLKAEMAGAATTSGAGSAKPAATGAAAGLNAASADSFRDAIKSAAGEVIGIRGELTKLAKTDPANPRVAELKGQLLSVQAAARGAVERLWKVGSAELGDGTVQSLRALRVAVQDAQGAMDPAKSREYSASFDEATKRADNARKSIERLRLVDPKNPKLPELEKQLSEVDTEARKTADALRSVGVAAKSADGPTGKLNDALGLMRRGLAALGLGIGAMQIGGWVNKTLAQADAVGKLSAQLGLATDELQMWIAFTAQAGASNEDLKGTVGALARNMQAAADAAGGPAAKAFATLGIKTDKWKEGLPPLSEMLATVGGALGDMTNGSERLALAQLLLGETGTKLIPGFKGGTAAAKAQLATLKELAVVYSDEFVTQAEAANDELDLFKRQLQGTGSEILLGILPQLRSLVRGMTSATRGTRDLLGGTNILSGAFAGLASMFGGRVWTMIAARFAAMAAGAGGVGGALAGIARTVGPLLLKFLRFAAVATIFDDLLTFLRGGKSATGELLDSLLGLGTAEGVLDTLKDLVAGLTGSLQIMWGTLTGNDELVSKGEANIDRFWGSVKNFGSNATFMFHDLWLKHGPKSMVDGLAKMDQAAGRFQDQVLESFRSWGKGIASFFTSLFDEVVGGFDGAAEMAKRALAKLPLVGSLFSDSPAAPALAQAASNAADGAGAYSEPFSAGTSSTSRTINYNDNSTYTTNLNGVNGRNVGDALAKSERRVVDLSRDKRQTLKQAVGAY